MKAVYRSQEKRISDTFSTLVYNGVEQYLTVRQVPPGNERVKRKMSKIWKLCISEPLLL